MANTRDTIGDQATVDGLVNHTLTELEEDGVTTLGNYALYNNTALTAVKFPNLTNTGQNAFYGCTGIQHITAQFFPNLATIANNAFYNCTGLVDAIFPAVTSVQSGAFYGCSNLEKIDFTGTSPVAITSGAFSNCAKLDALFLRSTTMSTLSASGVLAGTKIALGEGAVYVPTALVDTYKANNYWKDYFIADINDYPVTDFSTIQDSWTEIFANEANGTYSTKYKIGDTKQLDLGTEGKHFMEIVAFDTDDKPNSGGKAKITWISKTLLNTTKAMNSSQKTVDGETAYTAGGWENSDMRAYLKNTIKPLIPEVVRNNIVEVTKVQSIYTGGALVKDGQTTTDDVWIPGAREIFNNSNYETTGAVYSSKFTSNANRIKYRSGSANYWWLRSAGGAGYFRCVGGGGGGDNGYAGGSSGVALGFCT